jgi:2,4-dienoyl-CoA reductase-like NADH-dependent reductase (Old Yellow Enzyme family)/thioredoxin reductase
MEFPHLLQPFPMKNLALRNRIVMAPMLSRLCDPDGIVSQKLIDYYAERAKGGVGLIIVEYCYIDEKESKANQGQLGVYSDQLIAGLGDLAEAIQEWGAKAILQICHAGRSTSSRYMGRQPIAPSAMPGYTGEMAREMTPGEIEAVMESFAEGARRAKTAGFDGVELHGTHGYLMAQFLSPHTNHRTDIYGKDRGLFALQTLERVRARVGRDYLVGYRMSGDEFVEGGITLEEARAFARRLEERGIDYLHVSGGIIEVGENFVIPMYFPKGYLLHLAEGIKQAVKIPIIAVGAVHDPYLAEESLKRKRADLIAMGRALIADPEYPGKIRSGRPEDIRTCLRCNEGCSSRVRQGKTQRCAVNAEVGRERTLRIHSASKPKQVVVIGGGPAGMEAARVLALRRHKVTLIEKENELGGLLRYASVPDFKEELRGFLEYLKTQVIKTGVEVLRGRRATLDLVKELHPDAVVLAAGSTMPVPEIPGAQKPFAANALDLLSGKFQPGDRVVVAGGAAMGCEIAAHLASLGKKVAVVEMMGGLALDLENRSRVALLHLLKERRVSTFLNWRLERIEEGSVLLSDRDRNRKEVGTDSVILALGLRPNQDLVEPLRRNFAEVHEIGDCLEPRKIYQAVHEGAFAGRAI